MNDMTSPRLKNNVSDLLPVRDGSAPALIENEALQEEIEPAVIETQEQKYAKLGSMIDALSARNDLSLLHDAVIELQGHAQQLKLFREDVQSHRLYRDRR